MATPEASARSIMVHNPNFNCEACPSRAGNASGTCDLSRIRSQIPQSGDIQEVYDNLEKEGYDLSYLKVDTFLPGITEFEVYCSRRQEGEDTSLLVEQYEPRKSSYTRDYP